MATLADYVLEIAGTPRTIHLPSLELGLVANGRDYLRVIVVSAGGAYRPSLGQEVILSEDGTDIFGGVIAKTTETGVDGLPVGDIATEITVDAFNFYADRRFVTETFTAGTDFVDILDTLVTNYLADFGVTLDAGQATGPALTEDLVIDGEALSSVLQTLTDLAEDLGTGESWLWEIDPAKVFRMFEAGSVAAPVNVVDGDGHAKGDIVVTRSRDKYANRVIVKAGTPGILSRSDSFTGDGTTDDFTLKLPIQGPIPYSATGAIAYAVVDIAGGTESLGGVSSSLNWTYDPTTQQVTRTLGAPGNGVTFTVRYDAQYPISITAEDATEITNNGLQELIVSYPNVYDPDVAQTLADALLAKALTTKTEVKFETYEPGILPGQTLTVTAASRNVNADFLVTEVRAKSDTLGLRRTVIAVEGDVFRGSFREVYRAWLGGGGASVTASTPGPTASSGGGGIPSPPNHAVQFNNAGLFGGSTDFLWGSTETYSGFPANLQVKVVDESRYNLALEGPATTASTPAWLAQVFTGGNIIWNGGRDWTVQPSRDYTMSGGRDVFVDVGAQFSNQIHLRSLVSAYSLALGAIRTVATTYEIDVTGAIPLTTIYAVPTTNDTNIVFPSLTTEAANPASGQYRVLVTRHDSTSNTVRLRPKSTGESINNSSEYVMTPLETVVWQGLTGTGAGWKPIARFSSST